MTTAQPEATPRATLPQRTPRVRLAGEIVLAYVQVRRAIRDEPITGALARLRSPEAVPESPGRPPGEVAVLAPDEREQAAHARHLASAVERTLALVPGDTRCLNRSLVLSRLLARRGIPAKLVIGARSAPAFAAHAWVEHDGRPILSPGDAALGRLAEL